MIIVVLVLVILTGAYYYISLAKAPAPAVQSPKAGVTQKAPESKTGKPTAKPGINPSGQSQKTK